MITKTVKVSQFVEVTVDETKFDKEFMDDFRRYFIENIDSLDEHIMHLATFEARGLTGDSLEGYGLPQDMGISMRVVDAETEIEE